MHLLKKHIRLGHAGIMDPSIDLSKADLKKKVLKKEKKRKERTEAIKKYYVNA